RGRARTSLAPGWGRLGAATSRQAGGRVAPPRPMDLTLTQGAPVLLHLLQLSGTMALGLSTALAAQRRGRDVFGVAALALIAALGGGTLRDLLLASTLRDGAARGGAPRDGLPVFWMDEPSYLGAVAALALAGSLLVRARLLQR